MFPFGLGRSDHRRLWRTERPAGASQGRYGGAVETRPATVTHPVCCSPLHLCLSADQMLHMWDRKRLLWHNATRLWDSHFRWTQPGQLHVSVYLHLPGLCKCFCVQMRGEKCYRLSTFQVLFNVSNQQRWDGAHWAGQAEILMYFLSFSVSESDCILLFSLFRSPTCGRCTKSVAGTFSQPATVSESNMRISFPSQQQPVFGMQSFYFNWQ